ncbi:MAG: hypothetical protein M1347_02815, partial [Chloroflexi bacterium]|nr:hypothetical protein [Chloroflexota bacterium]
MQKPEENYLYDPLEAPDPDAWLALDESERRYKTLEYHLLFEKDLPAPEAHATIHTIVETQLAMEVKPLPATLMRLMEEGLNRHEAIHAIASVLI